MARVIVLNGISSAGKTSLAREVQKLSTRDWLLVSMDAFIAMIPDGREMLPDWFVVSDKTADPAVPLISITNGPHGRKLFAAMRAFVADAAAGGMDVIVDDVCTAEDVADYRQRLHRHNLHVVKVSVPVDEAERREKARGDRMIGLAREQDGRIHREIDYDFTVDNGDGSLAGNARELLALFD